MDTSTLAAWFSRGTALAGLVATLCAAFGWHLTDDQTKAIASVCGFVLLVCVPAYEKYHAKGASEKVALANEAVSAKEFYKATPSPLAASLATTNTEQQK